MLHPPLSSFCFLLCEPKPQAAYVVVVNELNTGIFKSCLNPASVSSGAHPV
jgi:hypothetical protein